MMKKCTLITLLCGVLFYSSNAQETWSLKRCIEYAQQNSLTIKRAEIDIRNAQLSEKGNKLAMLPDLNASTRGQVSFGRTINFTTNTFENERRGDQSLSLNAGLLVYGGNQIRNSIKQSQFDIAAAKADAENTSNDIGLQVARAYLSILLAQEQLTNAMTRKSLTDQQLIQTNKLIDAGTRPQSDRLDIEAQQARDEQAIITQQNNLTINYLNLKQLMQLPPDTKLGIESPEIEIPVDVVPESYTLQDVYAQAVNNQPIVRAGEMRLRAAELDVDIAKANMLPSVSLFGSLSSNYSTARKDFANPNRDNVQVVFRPQDVRINGNTVMLEIPEEIGLTYPDQPYFDQLSDNFGQVAGISISIPIFNNGRNSIAMERARLNIIGTEVTNQQIRQELKSNIQLAIADAQAAKKQVDAAAKSVNALEMAYNNADKRYKLGAINTFEFTTAKNNIDQARVDYIVAKYDYIFKLKIIDFYLGKTIDLQ